MNLKPAFPNRNIPIAISCSNRYVPYVSVMLQSIIENSSKDRNYDIVILNKDYDEHNKAILLKQCSLPNFSLRFYDVNEYISGKNFYTKNLSVEAYFRMFLTDIMNQYDKILYFDVDVCVLCDVAELYDINIKNNYIAAAVDVNIVGSYLSGNHWKPYIDEVLCLKEPEKYVQSGVMILNLKELRKAFTLKQITDICTSKEWRLFDQDILNSICQDKIYLLDMHYNTINGLEGRMENIEKWTPEYLKKQWFEARKAPKIVHYVGKKKPWLSFNTEYSEYFWDYAKRSMYYHSLIVGRVVQVDMLQAEKKIDTLKRQVDNQAAVIEQLKKSNAAAQKPAAAPPKPAAVPQKPAAVPQKPAAVPQKPAAAAPQKPAAAAPQKTAPAVKKAVLPAPKDGRAVLIRCQSVYQLFNAINLTANVLSGRSVDIMLTATTDFSQYIEPLKKSGLFRKVLTSEDTPQTYIDWRGLSKDKQALITNEPEKYVFKLENEPDYSDFYIAVADEYNKIFYYYLLKSGCYVKVHIFEDGMNSYILDNKKNCDTDFIDHSIYGDKCFGDNICEMLTYVPEVAINRSSGIKCSGIPKINSSKKTRRLYNSIFQYERLPKEKYIFMEEAFYCDGISSTDVELVEKLAEMVGKDNIIVKLHPRNTYDRFSARGFKVMQKSKTPWEMTLLNENLSGKVFVTVSSTAALTSGLVFSKHFTAINLFNVMTLGKNIHVRNSKFLEFYKMLQIYFNRDTIQMFTPLTIEEFEEEIFYLEGGI